MSASQESEAPASASESAELGSPRHTPDDSGPAVARLDREQRAAKHSRLLLTLVAVVAVVAFFLLPLAAVLPQLLQQGMPAATPTPQPTATPLPPVVFRQDVFSFRYPGGWWLMGPTEAKLVRLASLQDATPEEGSYIGGVFTEGMDPCRDCAQIVVSVRRDASLVGTLTEAQYQVLRAASEKALGTRLLSQRRVEVSSLPAVESVYLDGSGEAKVWEFLIVAPQPGLAYRLLCSSHQDSFAAFEPVFQEAIATLQIAAQPLASGPTRVPRRTPTPVRLPTPTAVTTYTVQAGDVLGQIAKDLGVALEVLAAANGLEDPYIIQPGQVLTVPLGAR